MSTRGSVVMSDIAHKYKSCTIKLLNLSRTFADGFALLCVCAAVIAAAAIGQE